MYIVDSTKAYRSAYKRVSKHKNFDRQALEKILDILSSGERLEPKYQDHQLTGEFKEYRECHIKNDLLLMYQKYEDILILLLIDIGTHDDLFS